MWNGTRHECPFPVSTVAVRWLMRTTVPTCGRRYLSSTRDLLAASEVFAGCFDRRRSRWCCCGLRLRVRKRRFDGGIGQFPFAPRAFFVQRDLRVLHRHDLAAAQLAVAPAEEAHGLPQIHVRAHGDDPSRVGQEALDDGAQLAMGSTLLRDRGSIRPVQ